MAHQSVNQPAAPALHSDRPAAECEFGVQDRLNVQLATLECVLAIIERVNDKSAGSGPLASAELVLRQSIKSLYEVGEEVSELEMMREVPQATIDRIMPPYPDRDPPEVWPGVADVNTRGVALAIELLTEFERNEEIGSGVHVRDLSELQDWPRLGTPFRNIVAEYLQRARESGPGVEARFCAVLTDMIAAVYNGCVMDTDNAARYAELYPAAKVSS